MINESRVIRDVEQDSSPSGVSSAEGRPTSFIRAEICR
jgi:hypothetical protein